MSNARRHRRRIGRTKITYRPIGVELSHETRLRVRQVLDAHDDDNVDMDVMRQVIDAFWRYALTLPDAERIEACLRVADRAACALIGLPVETVAVVTNGYRMPAGVVRRIG